MTMPLIVLAVLSVVGGVWLNGGALPHAAGTLSGFLAPAVGGPGEHGAAHAGLDANTLMVISVLVGIAGIAAAWFMQGAFIKERPNPFRSLVENRYGYDALLHSSVVVGGTAFAKALWQYVDVGIIDNLVNAVGLGVSGAAEALRGPQTGFVRNYALTMLMGAVVVLGLFVFLAKG